MIVTSSNDRHVKLLGWARTHRLTLISCSSIPTVGFNMKRVQRGHVTLKCWDIGGQPRFRTMWERYCRGVSAIVFIVDIADKPLIPQARDELHDLMGHRSLAGIPLLVLGNKSDLEDKLSVDELIEELDLKSIQGREVCCYGISAKAETNLDAVVNFLMKWASRV
jgi:ADP-ribosylation factor-like protein 8